MVTHNKYKILSAFKEKKTSTENVVDLLYSIFSFKLLTKYFTNYTIMLILDSINKKLTNKEIVKYNEVIMINIQTFFIEMLHWGILQTKYKQNRGNILFSKKVYYIEELSNIIKKFIESVYNSVNIKNKPKTIEKIKDNILSKMLLEDIIPFLEKNHLPPLASKHAFKTHKVKEKKSINLLTDENNYEYYLYRENDIVSKFPISYVTSGFQMKRFRDENYIYVNLRYFLHPKYIKLLQKRYNKKTNFNNAVFYLLSYYHLNGLLEDTGYINNEIPKIKNKKINNLYKSAIELVGTPLTVSPNKKYFGLFPDIEKHFGSLGSFYDFEPQSGVYSITLPISYLFISDTITKIKKWLRTSDKMTFLLWLPLNVYTTDGFIIPNKSLLKNIYTDLIPKIIKSDFYKELYYYLYDKKATPDTASHIIYIMSNSDV